MDRGTIANILIFLMEEGRWNEAVVVSSVLNLKQMKSQMKTLEVLYALSIINSVPWRLIFTFV